MLPCVLFEDDDLLVVSKPAGMNTHAPGPFAGEGLYDWLRGREPRWGSLAIIHRLDKETSGVMVFAKSPRANRSLTEQFTQRTVSKKYLFLTDRPAPAGEFTARSALVRVGERYVSRPPHAGADLAETVFARSSPDQPPGATPPLIGMQARPLTGRTHQIRVQAAEAGFPVLGDTLYGGTPTGRLCLHAAELAFCHPATGENLVFQAPVDFEADARLSLRGALMDPEATNAWRVLHGASDGSAGWYVDRLGEYLLSQNEQSLTVGQREILARLVSRLGARGVHHKFLNRTVRGAAPESASPQVILGEPAPERFTVLENGLVFELSFEEGYSVGLFLDQRDNRRRLLIRHVAAEFDLPPGVEVLNTFAYTCGFSVAAAKGGARVTSLDLSKKYLEWGRRNLVHNGLDPAAHEFIYGDTFDWLRRLGRKGRSFDLILLDPPTFSQSKASGTFQAKRDYGRLAQAALLLLKAGGVLFASTNAADWPPEDFLDTLEEAARAARRTITRRHYAPQPPDFPVSRAEPAYLKTVWLQMA